MIDHERFSRFRSIDITRHNWYIRECYDSAQLKTIMESLFNNFDKNKKDKNKSSKRLDLIKDFLGFIRICSQLFVATCNQSCWHFVEGTTSTQEQIPLSTR